MWEIMTLGKSFTYLLCQFIHSFIHLFVCEWLLGVFENLLIFFPILQNYFKISRKCTLPECASKRTSRILEQWKSNGSTTKMPQWSVSIPSQNSNIWWQRKNKKILTIIHDRFYSRSIIGLAATSKNPNDNDNLTPAHLLLYYIQIFIPSFLRDKRKLLFYLTFMQVPVDHGNLERTPFTSANIQRYCFTFGKSGRGSLQPTG